MLKTILLSSVCFLCVCYADFDAAKWRFYKPLEKNTSDKPYLSVLLDPEVLEAARTDLADLRIVEGAGKETPYRLEVLRKEETSETLYPKVFNKSFFEGQSAEFLLDFQKPGVLKNGIQINTALDNFRRVVRVYGSEDALSKDWKLLRKDALIFDISDSYYSNQHTGVVFPENTFRYLKVVVLNNGEKKDFDIKSVTSSQKILKPGVEVKREFKIIKQELNAKQKAMELLLDLGKSKLPFFKIKLNIAEKNYHRYVAVFAGDEIEKLSSVANTSIYNYTMPAFTEYSDTVEFSEVCGRYVKLLIYYYDDKPLTVKDISLSGYARKAIFKAVKEAEYKIYYGKEQSSMPVYDIKYYSGLIKPSEMFNLKAEVEMPNTAYIPKEKQKKGIPGEKYLLWVVILLVAGAILTMVYGIVKKSDEKKV
ncbi:MAG: hypothetical protein A2231_08510 [Candidatus Firestonebacteria bacterium RIFOXYA2_FULL_40_8]|nr:MAG: hypothetical protein A2231_08510 [Candidatus Firestonebacteria bacterium RIFOXYA2_FULL_40_8]